jgi:hypothetical protein
VKSIEDAVGAVNGDVEVFSTCFQSVFLVETTNE